jgi:hypothetical protein
VRWRRGQLWEPPPIRAHGSSVRACPGGRMARPQPRGIDLDGSLMANVVAGAANGGNRLQRRLPSAMR